MKVIIIIIYGRQTTKRNEQQTLASLTYKYSIPFQKYII